MPSWSGYQPAYEEADHKVFEALDKMETILTRKDYIMGDQLTEADVRLYVTAVHDFHAECGYSLTGTLRFDLILLMSDIPSATFAPFVTLFMFLLFLVGVNSYLHLQVDVETLLEE